MKIPKKPLRTLLLVITLAIALSIPLAVRLTEPVQNVNAKAAVEFPPEYHVNKARNLYSQNSPNYNPNEKDLSFWNMIINIYGYKTADRLMQNILANYSVYKQQLADQGIHLGQNYTNWAWEMVYKAVDNLNLNLGIRSARILYQQHSPNYTPNLDDLAFWNTMINIYGFSNAERLFKDIVANYSTYKSELDNQQIYIFRNYSVWASAMVDKSAEKLGIKPIKRPDAEIISTKPFYYPCMVLGNSWTFTREGNDKTRTYLDVVYEPRAKDYKDNWIGFKFTKNRQYLDTYWGYGRDQWTVWYQSFEKDGIYSPGAYIKNEEKNTEIHYRHGYNWENEDQQPISAQVYPIIPYLLDVNGDGKRQKEFDPLFYQVDKDTGKPIGIPYQRGEAKATVSWGWNYIRNDFYEGVAMTLRYDEEGRTWKLRETWHLVNGIGPVEITNSEYDKYTNNWRGAFSIRLISKNIQPF